MQVRREAGGVRMARPKVNGRMLSTDALEGHCNEHGGLYFPPGVGGAYACLLPDGTLIVCGGGFPYYCVESRTVEDEGLGLSEAQTQDLTAQAADYERFRIRAKAELDLAEVDVDALVEDEGSDIGAIENALKKSEAARTAMRQGGISARRAALAVLTPEQRSKFRSGIRMRLGGSSEGYGRHAGEGAEKPEPTERDRQ
jgi:Heavy-metal resistance